MLQHVYIYVNSQTVFILAILMTCKSVLTFYFVNKITTTTTYQYSLTLGL